MSATLRRFACLTHWRLPPGALLRFLRWWCRGEEVIARRLMLALIAALIVSGLFTFWLSRKMTRSHSAAPVPNRYAAAAHALAAGQVVKREDVSLINWPKSVPLQGAFMKPEDVVGRAVLYPVSAGEPLLDRQ